MTLIVQQGYVNGGLDGACQRTRHRSQRQLLSCQFFGVHMALDAAGSGPDDPGKQLGTLPEHPVQVLQKINIHFRIALDAAAQGFADLHFRYGSLCLLIGGFCSF